MYGLKPVPFIAGKALGMKTGKGLGMKTGKGLGIKTGKAAGIKAAKVGNIRAARVPATKVHGREFTFWTTPFSIASFIAMWTSCC